MAEITFMFSPDTQPGSGLIFCDLNQGHSWAMWWTWDHHLGWYGPIGAYVNPKTLTVRRPTSATKKRLRLSAVPPWDEPLPLDPR